MKKCKHNSSKPDVKVLLKPETTKAEGISNSISHNDQFKPNLPAILPKSFINSKRRKF